MDILWETVMADHIYVLTTTVSMGYVQINTFMVLHIHPLDIKPAP